MQASSLCVMQIEILNLRCWEFFLVLVMFKDELFNCLLSKAGMQDRFFLTSRKVQDRMDAINDIPCLQKVYTEFVRRIHLLHAGDDALCLCSLLCIMVNLQT